MSTVKNTAQPIIKKVKKGGHAHAHSSAWKVAYADFVTAMMAFFLLLWLLNVSTDEQRLGIANYFLPTTDLAGEHGSVGFSGGLVTDMEGPLNAAPMSTPSIVVGLPVEEIGGDGSGDGDGDDFENLSNAGARDPGKERPVLDRAVEEAKFQEIERKLHEAIQADPELRGLEANLEIDRTEEGLRIQIVDQDDRSMFPRGSDVMHAHMHRLLAQVAGAVADTPNAVAISGHTDATPFRAASSGDNWALSSARANAARKVLVDAGLDGSRLERVTGEADTEPHAPEDPDAASNRRIAIVLLYGLGPRPELTTPPVDGAKAVRNWLP